MSSEELSTLSLHDLRERCKKSNLSTKGSKQTLRKRLAATDDDDGSRKRAKKTPADDLICPITRELPWEPVTAEDGRVYEKEAILCHIRQHKNDLKSPITNERMGKRLYPALHHKSLIETLIENEYITGDLAKAWQVKANEVKEVEKLLADAAAGDRESMYCVAEYYSMGSNGFKKSFSEAYTWYRKSHLAGNVKATSGLGEALCKGWGTDQSYTEGIMYTAMAAAQGSDYAARRLGFIFANGKFGVEENETEAIHWLDMSVNGCMEHSELNDDAIDFGRKKLTLLLDGDEDHDDLDDDDIDD